MAAAAQLVKEGLPGPRQVEPGRSDEDRLTVHELLARLSGLELLAASQETSPVYDGLVLAEAVQIVQDKTGLKISELQRSLSTARTVYRWRSGKPIARHSFFDHAMRELAFALKEYSRG